MEALDPPLIHRLIYHNGHVRMFITNQILHFNPICSENDIQHLEEICMKYDGVTPILEEDHGFSLILHQRDFTPGAPILQNIAEAVTKTRRMIMLLTR